MLEEKIRKDLYDELFTAISFFLDTRKLAEKEKIRNAQMVAMYMKGDDMHLIADYFSITYESVRSILWQEVRTIKQQAGKDGVYALQKRYDSLKADYDQLKAELDTLKSVTNTKGFPLISAATREILLTRIQDTDMSKTARWLLHEMGIYYTYQLARATTKELMNGGMKQFRDRKEARRYLNSVGLDFGMTIPDTLISD